MINDVWKPLLPSFKIIQDTLENIHDILCPTVSSSSINHKQTGVLKTKNVFKAIFANKFVYRMKKSFKKSLVKYHK